MVVGVGHERGVGRIVVVGVRGRRRNSHVSQMRRDMGHPLFLLLRVWKSKATSRSRSKATDRSVCSTGAKATANVKNGAAGVRGSHLSQKTRKMGHPLLMRVPSKSRSRSKATDGSVRSTGASLRSADGRGGCLHGRVHGENSLRRWRSYKQCRGPSTAELLRFARQFLRSG